MISMFKFLLADVFENFWNICLKIYKPDLARITWQAALKKTKVKLDL